MSTATPSEREKYMYALLIAITAAVGGLLFGYDTSVISGAILFVRKEFRLSSLETEMAVSVVLAGAALGAGSAGYFADRFGRKPVLAANAVIFGVFAVVTGLAKGLGLFLLARFVVGLAVGVASMITPLYIAELSPRPDTGSLCNAEPACHRHRHSGRLLHRFPLLSCR